MSGKRINMPESVRHRLRNMSRETRMPPDALMQFYTMERFLYRLGRSRYADRFVLKGALLLLAWQIAPIRPTRDIDLRDTLKVAGSPALSLAAASFGCFYVAFSDGKRVQVQ